MITVAFVYFKSRNILVSIVVSFVPVITALVSNYINVFLYSLVIGNIHDYVKHFNNYVIFSIGMMIITFIISKILGYLVNKKLIITEINITNNSQILSLVKFTVIMVATFYMILIFGNDYHSDKIQMISTLGTQLLIFTILVMGMFNFITNLKKEDQLQRAIEMADAMKAYAENLEGEQDAVRLFRHDFKNMFSGILGFIQERAYEGLEKYVVNCIMPESKGITDRTINIDCLKNIKIPELKGTVSSKLTTIKSSKLNFKVDIPEAIHPIKLNGSDITKIMGILLDNAIEASQESEKRKLDLAILNNIQDERNVVIIIKNSFSGGLGKVSELYKKGVSTKGNNRGLGLYSLKAMLERQEHGNASMDIMVEDDEFTVILKFKREEY